MLLPIPIVSRIASFNVDSTSHLASLRRVSRSFHKSLLVHVGRGDSGRHHVRCPAFHSDLVLSFLDGLCLEHEGYAHCGDLIQLGEAIDGSIFKQKVVLESVRVFSCSWESGESSATPSSIDKVFDVCDSLHDLESLDDLNQIVSTVASTWLTNPLVFATAEADKEDGSRDFYRIRGLVSVSVDIESAVGCLRSHNGREWLELTTRGAVEEEDSDIRPLYQNCVYAAPVTCRNESTIRAIVLIDFLLNEDKTYSLMEDGQCLESLFVKTPWETAQRNERLVEGVTIVDDFFAGRESLCEKIDAFKTQQEQMNAVDFHPNSNGVVRNIVHPAKYCYVDEVTQLRKPTLCCQDTTPGSNTDFWGRSYEKSVFQWLPTYFSISEDGSCVIEDYINNLGPRDTVNAALYKELEQLFECCLPFMESTYSYVQAIRPHLRGHDEDTDYDASAPSPPDIQFCSLRGQKLQVITKVVDYNLLHDQTHSGVWHVEGMSHEEIVLTVLYIADRDEDFSGADLLFRRAFLRREAEYLFSNIPQCRHVAVDEVVAQGLVPLGTVSTPKGRLIVFPNSHVHKVSEMAFDNSDDSDKKSSKRRIVVFFLVNPLKRIVSTREVAPQQQALGGIMSHEDALEYRRQLMHERRHTKQDWNVREIELCEH